MVMVLLISIPDVIIFLILQQLLNLLEIADLADLHLQHGLLLKKNGKMIQMHFYFLLIRRKYILIKIMVKLFILIKIMGLHLGMDILFIQVHIAFKTKSYIHMNQIQVVVIISMEIIMLYLKVVVIIFMHLNMKFFRLYFNNFF